MGNYCREHELISSLKNELFYKKKKGSVQKSRFSKQEATLSKTIRTSAVSYLNNQPVAKADVAHLRNMKYVKNWDFPMVNTDLFLHQAHTLADSNNVCQSPCRNVSTHAKGL